MPEARKVNIDVVLSFLVGNLLCSAWQPVFSWNLNPSNAEATFVKSIGTDISTSPLALARDFLKKGLSGKYILVFTCPKGQADFLNTLHISFIVNVPNTQRYAKNATELNRKW